MLGCTEIVWTLTTYCAPGVFSTHCSRQVEAAHLVEGDSLGEDEGDSLGEGEGDSLGLQSSGPLSRIKWLNQGLHRSALAGTAVSILTFGAPKGARKRADQAAKVTACMCMTHLGVGDEVRSGVGDGVGSGVVVGVALQTYLAHEVPRKGRSSNTSSYIRVSNESGFAPSNK